MSDKMDSMRWAANASFSRLRVRRGWTARFEFKLPDLWVGAFWKRSGNCVDLWVCLLPCVPLHVLWWRTVEPVESPRIEPQHELGPS